MIRNLSLLFFLAAALPSISLAEIQVFVRGSLTPQKASLIVFQADEMYEYEANWSTTEDKAGLLVTSSTAPVPNDATLASALVIDETGEYHLSTPAYALSQRNMLERKMCGNESLGFAVQPGQAGLLRSLVDVRMRRLNASKARLAQVLDSDTVEHLARIEKGFGFESKPPLSVDLPAVELAHRLDRLLHTIRRYEYFKEKQ